MASLATARGVTRGLSTFVGRAGERELFLARLASGHRLVTVVGPPGAGKSRFASYTLAGLEGRAIVACDASTVTDADELVGAVHAALGVDPGTGVARAVDALGPAVLLLDDVDRVIGAAASWIEDLVSRAPRLSVVLTSQRRSGIAGEACVEIASLSLDEAVDLFAARSRLLRPDFQVTDANRGDVERLVSELDRLPLAVELAAGRAAVLGPREILARTSQRFELLRARGGEDRRVHLEGAIAVAFDLLTPAEREALTQAAVFPGSFTLEGAEAVLQLGGGHTPLDVLDALAARSLVRSFEPATLPGELRFSLWETVRAFALRQAPPGALEAARDRLATYAATVAEEFERRREAGEAPIDEIALEAPIFDAVFESHVDHDPRMAALVLLAERPLVDAYGPVAPYERRLSRAAAALELGVDEGTLAKVLVAAGRARVMLGKLDAGRAALSSGADAAARAGLPAVEAEARSILALALYWQGFPDDAARLHGDATAAPLDAAGGFARGLVLLLGGRPSEAREVLRDVVDARRRGGDVSDLGLALALYGNACMECADAALARTLFDEAEVVLERAKNRRFLAILELWRGSLALDQGRFVQGTQHLDRAHAGLMGAEDRLFLRSARGYLGIAHHLLGDAKAALAWFDQAVAGAAEDRHQYPLGHFLVHKAAAEARLGDLDAAEDTFARAESHVAAALRPSLVATSHVLRGLLHLARADRSHDDVRRRHLANAELEITRGTGQRAGQPDRIRETSLDVRLALRLAEPLLAERLRDLAGPPLRAVLRVGPEAAFFHVGDGPRVDLSRRALLRRLLECLAAKAIEDPGATVDSFALLDAGWPGEQVSAESGLHRVHVALATLRKMGLGPVLRTDPSGYRIGAEIVRLSPA